MPHYLNLSVALRYDFIVTYFAVVFFVNWTFAMLRITRLSNVFRRVWESRNRQIRSRKSGLVQKSPRE